MGVILDTDLVAPSERADALQAVFGAHEVPQQASFVAPAERVQHRLEIVSFGAGVQLIRLRGTGLAVERTERHVRQGAPVQVSVFTSIAGGGDLVRNGHATTFRAGDLGVMDTMRPYSWNPAARIEHAVLVVDDPQTGLPVEKLCEAADRVRRSPLHGLLRTHLASLCAIAGDLAPDAMDALGAATHQILRAALVTAVDGPGAEACLDESLFARMAGYAESHLHDPDLTPRGSPLSTTSPCATCTRCGSARRGSPPIAGSCLAAWSVRARSSRSSTARCCRSAGWRDRAGSPT